MIRITDKAFSYTPSYSTDIGKRFRAMEKARRAATRAATAQATEREEPQQRPANVALLRKK